jgi:hypothetical protein
MRRTFEICRIAALIFGLAGGLASSLVAQEPVYARQTSQGEVVLEVQPRWEEGVLLFEITANTHTVELGGVDLLKSTRLLMGADTLAPVSAGSFKGHHASVTVRFEIRNRPEKFDLEIRDVPDVPVRVLRWPPPRPGEGQR